MVFKHHFFMPHLAILKGLSLCMMAALSLNGATTISPWTIVSAPTKEVKQDTTISIMVASRTAKDTLKAGCGIYYNSSSVGSQKAGHAQKVTRFTDSEGPFKTRVLTFRPSSPDTTSAGKPPQMPLGIQYLVVACPDTSQLVTPEIPLRIVATQAPSFLTPNSIETNARPEITWSAVPGVPAYHLLLSDQELKIDPNAGSVSGASIIWQAIVTGNSITYGNPDPSGNFNAIAAPPLSNDVPYNLVILNNYDGKSALATSTRAQGLRLFTLNAPDKNPDRPKIVLPAKGAVFGLRSDSNITFRWTASNGKNPANVYRLFIYSSENQQGSTVLLPVWQGETTDTTLVMDSKHTLLNQKYQAKVFAITEAGFTSISDTIPFYHNSEVQTLSVAARGPNGAGDTVQLDNVRVTVTPITGSGQPFPMYCVSDQRTEKELSAGSYVLEFVKDGYLADRQSVTLAGSGTKQVTGFLSRPSGQIQFRAVGDDGQPLSNASALLTTNTGIKLSAAGDANGRFLIGAKPGRYVLRVSRNDYSPHPDTTIDLATNETKSLGNIQLKKATGVLSGTVSSSTNSLPGATVIIKTSAGEVARSILTDGTGRFQTLLSPGNYTITAAYAGMVGATQKVTLAQTLDLRFLLQGGASIVRGKVKLAVSGSANSVAPLQNASVTLESEDTGEILATSTDVNGDYSFSTAETGDFTLLVSHPNATEANEVQITISKQHTTVVKDLALRSLPTLKGDLRLQPDSSFDIGLISLNLIDDAEDFVVKQGEVYRDSTGLHYQIENIADGDYRLSAFGGGYATETEPDFSVEQGVLTASIPLTLTKIAGTLIFSLRSGDSTIAGTIRLLSPVSLSLISGDTLKPASFGTYQLAAKAEDKTRLPLIRLSTIVQKNGTSPVQVQVKCPFFHTKAPEKQKDGRYLFLLEEDALPDSGTLTIQTQNGLFQHLSLEPQDNEVIEIGGARQIWVRLPPSTIRIRYWFEVFQNGNIYSNADPSEQFQFSLFKPGELAEIRLDIPDSIRVPANNRSIITVSTFDADGNSLDSSISEKGAVKWRHFGKQSFSLVSVQGMRLTLGTGQADKNGLNKNAANHQWQADPVWDSLAITATYQGIERSAGIAVRVEDASIQFIRVSTSIGEVNQTESPRSISIRLMAFDTSFSPPLPLLPNPSFSIQPKDAGKLVGSQLQIDPEFIGPLRIFGNHTFADGNVLQTELFPIEDEFSRGINIGQTLKSKAETQTFRHGNLLQIKVPDSIVTLDAAAVLRLYRRSLPKTFTSLRDSAVGSEVWEIANPSGATLRNQMTLGLTVPNFLEKRSNALRQFDAIGLQWLPLDTLVTEFDGNLRPRVRATLKALDGNFWAVVSASQALEVSGLRIVPNPFSPRVTAQRDGNDKPGTRIHFRPDTPESPEVTVTLAIFTLEGERIRLLADHQTHPKTWIDYYWDGKTDDGRLVRNGRYLLALTITPTGGGRSKQYLRPVVVFQ